MTIKSVCNKAFNPGRENASLGVAWNGFSLREMRRRSSENPTSRRKRS